MNEPSDPMIGESKNPLRRMRIQLHVDHNPPIWAAYYEPPGAKVCYCHAKSLEEMLSMVKDYYAGNGLFKPLRVEQRLMKYIRDNEKNVGLSLQEQKERYGDG